jgi:hypothetical protein
MARLLVECTVRGTLTATVTAVILWATRIKTPVALHAAWTGVLLSMLLLPVWTVWGPRASMRVLPPMPAPREIVARLSGPGLHVPPANQRPLDTVDSALVQTQGRDWQRVLLGIYVVIACTLLARLAIGTINTQRLVRGTVRRDGRLTSAMCAAPITVGWFRPVAILPEHSHQWPPAQLDAVLTHEHEHARRRDPLVQWLALLNRAVFWFHPLAWWLERRLAALAEDACDAAVLAHGHDAGDYAEYLLDIARAVTRAGSRVMVVGTAMPGPHLARRIRQILSRAPAPRISRTRLVCTVAACAVSSAACAATRLEPANFVASGELRGLASVKASTKVHAERQQPVPAAPGASTPSPPVTLAGRQSPSPPPPPPPRSPRPDWKIYATDHFEIYFTSELDSQVDRVGREAERAYQQISADLRHDLAFSPSLILFTTRADLDRGLTSGTMQGRPDFRTRILLSIDDPSGRLQGDLVHEITHTFEFDIVPPSIVNMAPRWISEGLAQYERGEWDAGDRAILGDLVHTNTVLRMSELTLSSFPGDRRLNDSLGQAVFEFIASRWDKDGVRRFLAALRQSSSGDFKNVYRTALGLAPDEFDRAFDDYLQARFQ